MTIRDIANHSGVSTATVSRVINGSGKVTQQTREAVETAMRELNYQPNSIARSLRVDSTMTIGLIVTDHSNAHLAYMCKAIEDTTVQHGYIPIIASSNGSSEIEAQYIRLMQQRRVDGLIVHSNGGNAALIAQASRQIPTVAIYRRIADDGYRGDLVDTDSENGMYDLTRHMLDNGHRKIFIINGPLDISSGRDRFAGFVRAMREAGIDVGDSYPYRYDSDFRVDGGAIGCKRLLSMRDRPTALITANAEILLGALKTLRSSGILIPDQLSVASFVRPENADLFYVDITCSLQDRSVIGRRAASLLLERIRQCDIPNREIVYPPSIRFGNSVRNIAHT